MVSEGSIERVTEVISGSRISFEDAIQNGFARSSKTLRGITGLRVKEQYAHVEDGKIVEFRVTFEVIFVLER